MRFRRIGFMLVYAFTIASCADKKTNDDQETSAAEDVAADHSGTRAETTVKHKAAREAAASQTNLQFELLAAMTDPRSKVYADAAEHRTNLKKLAAENPNEFHKFLARLNAFRFAQGLPPLDAAKLKGLNLAQVSETEKAVVNRQADEKVAECIAAKMGPQALEAIVPGGDGKPDDPAAWDPNKPCPNNCVCAAATASAEAYAYAYAECSDGTKAFGYGYAYAFAYAFAYACVPAPPKPDACEEDPKPEEDACVGIAPEVDPIGDIVATNPECFDASSDEECGLTPAPKPISPEETPAPTGTGPDSGVDDETDSNSENGSGGDQTGGSVGGSILNQP